MVAPPRPMMTPEERRRRSESVGLFLARQVVCVGLERVESDAWRVVSVPSHSDNALVFFFPSVLVRPSAPTRKAERAC